MSKLQTSCYLGRLDGIGFELRWQWSIIFAVVVLVKILEAVLYNVCESILDFFEVGSYNFQSKFTIVAKLWIMSRKSYVYLNRYKGKYNTIQCTQGKCEVKDYFYITHANCTSSTILDTYRTGCIEQIRHTFNVFRYFIQLDFTVMGNITICCITSQITLIFMNWNTKIE